MFDWIRKRFKPQVEKEPMTTKNIVDEIERKREVIANRRKKWVGEWGKIEENLKLFPIGYPTSKTEISSVCDDMPWITLSAVLKKLIHDGEWEYVSDSSGVRIQRVK